MHFRKNIIPIILDIYPSNIFLKSFFFIFEVINTSLQKMEWVWTQIYEGHRLSCTFKCAVSKCTYFCVSESTRTMTRFIFTFCSFYVSKPVTSTDVIWYLRKRSDVKADPIQEGFLSQCSPLLCSFLLLEITTQMCQLNCLLNMF